MTQTDPVPDGTVAPRPGAAAGDRADVGVLTGGQEWRLLRAVLFSIIAFSSSMTIVSASLPTLSDSLGAPESTLAWTVTGLILANAVGTPVFGRLGDLHGHRRVFLAGAGLLTVATALCAVAWSAGALIGFRVLVGVGMSAAMPTGTAMVMAAFGPERRAEAMGWFQMAMTGAPVIGLVVGGPLVDYVGWRFVFVLLTPLAAAGFFMSRRILPDPPPQPGVVVDWAGAALLASSTFALLIGLDRGGRAGFADPWAVGLLLAVPVGLAAFVLAERTARQPLLQLRYFARRNFTGGLVAAPLTHLPYMGGFIITPILLEDRFGLSVTVVALVLLFRPGTYSVFSPLGGRLAQSQGERRMILGGSLLMAASMVVFAASVWTDRLVLVIAALAVSGAALGLSSPAHSTVVAGAVDDGDLGVANGMQQTMQFVGIATGIQIMVVLLGSGRAADDFAGVFLFGGAVALLSLIGGLLVSPRRR